MHRLKPACFLLPILFYASAAHGIAFTVSPTATSTDILYETLSPNSTTVQFSLDGAATVAVGFYRVSDADGSLSFVNEVSKFCPGAGACTINWPALWPLGADSGRQNGNYQFRAIATAGTDSVDSGLSSSVVAINSVDIHNFTLTPSLDAENNSTPPYIIRYALAKASNVTVTISSGSTVIRTLVSNKLQVAESVATQSVSWDGLLDNGQPAAIGIYSATIQATDPSSADTATPRTRSFAVTSLAGAASDPQQLFSRSIFVYPNPIVNGQGLFQFQAIREAATISLKIYTISGDLVLEKSFGNLSPGVVQIFTWDAVNQSGNKVGRGLYYYVFREDDAQGTLQAVKKLAVIQ